MSSEKTSSAGAAPDFVPKTSDEFRAILKDAREGTRAAERAAVVRYLRDHFPPAAAFAIEQGDHTKEPPR